MTVNNVVVGSTTSLTANFVLDPAAALGARTVTVTTAGGTSGPQTFTVNLPRADADERRAESRHPGHHGGGHADGHQFRRRRHDGGRRGGGVTVNNVVVGSSTSLTANFVLDPAAAAGARTVTVTTAGGTSGGQTFTINCRRPVPRRSPLHRAVRRPSQSRRA